MKTLKNKKLNITKKGLFKVLMLIVGLRIMMFYPSDIAFGSESENYEGGSKYTTRFDLSFEKELTDWEFYLHQNPESALIYGAFSQKLDENGNRIYSDEFIIGLLANIACEGSPGMVESAFSVYHQYGFCLPSGGKYIQTLDDVDYLLNWTTSNNGTKKDWASKGSCGVSSVQWSFGRRLQWCNILKNILVSSNRTECTLIDFNKANKEMFFMELDPKEYYYPVIIKCAKNNGGSAESYAEAICDIYEAPGSADLDMSNTGEACQTRRAIAKNLWSIFISSNVDTYEIITPESNVTNNNITK